jgi:hypothetical protein
MVVQTGGLDYGDYSGDYSMLAEIKSEFAG